MSAPHDNNHAALLVASLSYFKRGDLLLAGGKGANLGELSQIGFNVPPGFIVTTSSYDLLLKENGFQTRLREILASYRPENPDSAKKMSDQIQSLLQQALIPEQIKDAILEAYGELKHGAVAVRSSATAEDLPEAAFAGQQETFLNVIGETDLIQAVRACWMSLWSERAVLYRARQNVDQKTVKLAVVVQKMIEADAAGVMFTANPVTGERGELVIDANPGLGEAVVGGLVTPDHYVVHKRAKRIKAKRLGRREVVIRSKKEGGTKEIRETQETTNTDVLSPQTILKLSQLGMAIEKHYSVPQDIEWAWTKDTSQTGNLYVLQSRPMTALPEPLKVSGPMRMVVPMLAEMWPSRPYPLDMTTFTGTIERAIEGLLVAMIGKSAPNPDESFVEEDGVVLEFRPPQVRPSPSMLFSPFLTMWRTRHYDLSRWAEDPLLAEYIAKARSLEKRNVEALTWKQNIEIIREALALIPSAMQLRERYLPKALLGLASLWLLLFLARRGKQFGALVSGVRTKTTEINEALEDLAKQIRTNKVLKELFINSDTQSLQTKLRNSEAGREFFERFEEFLDRYGHRETALTISQPAWKDNPAGVLAILKVLAEGEGQKPESYNAWQKTRDALLADSILGTGLLRGLFLKSLMNARYLFQIREDTHFYATMVQPAVRRIALELGKRMVQIDAIDNAEDVFHFKLDELQDFGRSWPPAKQEIEQIRTLVARRKAKRQSLANQPMVDPRLLSITPQQGNDVLLSGTSGSPGIAQGPAKIVRDISEFGKLRTGDVLVAPVTNPAWTPLFQRAVAVVVDTGGLASHAAIVAREYGIPAVMGTVMGTKELEDGQWIRVDGSRGLVLKAEKQNEKITSARRPS
jgi:pyruvate,water dikinase